MTDFPAIKHVLAQYRSTGPGEVTREQIEAAWAEYEELRSRYQPRRGRFVMAPLNTHRPQAEPEG